MYEMRQGWPMQSLRAIFAPPEHLKWSVDIFWLSSERKFAHKLELKVLKN
jgi:hypothetical protein